MKIDKIFFISTSVLLAAATTNADPVDPDNTVTFHGGSATVTTEISAKFSELISAVKGNNAFNRDRRSRIAAIEQSIEDHEQRLTALEDGQPPANGIQSFNLDCDTDSSILATTIESAPLFTGLDIRVTGTCDPIVISRDYVSIVGPATITSNTDGDSPISVESGNKIDLVDLTLDAQTLAPTALYIDNQSEVITQSITLGGAISNVLEIAGSNLTFRGNTQITASGSARGMSATASYVRLEDGLTSISSEGNALLVTGGSLFAATNENANADIVGNVAVFAQSTISLFNTNITGNLDMSLSSSGFMRAFGANVSITGQINVNTHSYLSLQTDGASTLTTSGGNLLLISGGYVIVNDGVTIANAPSNFVVMRGGLLTMFGGTLEAQGLVSDMGSYLYIEQDAAVTAPALIRTNSVLISQQNTPIAAAAVLCQTGGVAVHRVGGTETDLCL